MCRFRVLSLLFALLSICLSVSVSAQFTWSRYYGATLVNDEAFSCIQTLDNNLLVTGYSGYSPVSSTLVKYSQTGEVLWSKNYESTWYMGVSVAEDPSGNLYTGFYRGLMKLDPFGNVIWQRELPDTIYAGHVKLTEDRTKLFRYNSDIIALSDTSADNIWTIRLNDTAMVNWNVYDLCQVGSFFYAAGTRSVIGSRRGFVRKYDMGGNLILTVQTPQGSTISTLAKNSDYSIIAAGGLDNLYCTMISQSGTVLWEKSYVQDSLAFAYSIKRAANNRFVIATAGYVDKSKCIVIDSSGTVIVSKDHPYGYLNNAYYQNVIVAKDSGFVFTGYIEFNESGSIDWLVVKTDKNGNTTPIGIEQISNNVPSGFKLYQNFPNPFNPVTKIKFDIPSVSGSQSVKFSVYDIVGRKVYSTEETKQPGSYEISFDAAGFSSGTYFYTIEYGVFKETRKMILIK